MIGGASAAAPTGSPRPGPCRRARASAGRSRRRRTPPAWPSPGRAPRATTPVAVTTSPSRSSWLTRIRRLVALSSTTSDPPAVQVRSPAPARRPSDQATAGRLHDEPERAALARDARALRDERAVHQLGEATADREAQARPAVLPGDRGVRLAERLEQPPDPVGRDADARVVDLEADRPPSGPSP